MKKTFLKFITCIFLIGLIAVVYTQHIKPAVQDYVTRSKYKQEGHTPELKYEYAPEVVGPIQVEEEN